MPNPFEVLQLDPRASEEDVVRQAERLRQRTTDAETIGAIRQAAMALTGKPEERALHALMTHPRPTGASPALERFAAGFRRPPQPAPSTDPCPDLDRAEFLRLLCNAAAEQLDPRPSVFEPLSARDDADEVRRQMAEAFWRSLLFDPRG
jgi:hypothetical protein